MHFLEPIWLVAMAGIALPVIVHFWNDRRGKVLRIGSIHFLEGSSQRVAWSRRVTQWWLLLLRCLLVMALALLLAGPYWAPRNPSLQGWVLADSGATAVYGGRIDSLTKAGWTLKTLRGADYWSAFRDVDSTAPTGAELIVFSSGLANRFIGSRPYTDREVKWNVYAPKDSANEWVVRRWVTLGDSLRVMRGVAKLTGSFFRYENVGGSSAEAGVDTASLYVTVHADGEYVRDGKYLVAALKAVQQFTQRRIKVNAMGDRGWLFWLSSKPVPVGYDVVWRYGMGIVKKVDTWVEGTGLYKEVEVGGNGEAVWRDGFGKGVLVKDGKTFDFYSRLDPEWGELVWSREFPALLARLLLGEEGPGDRDLRLIDEGQVGPVRRSAATAAKGLEIKDAKGLAAAGAIDLGRVSWILILILFTLERWLSNKD